jgi:hypothetical protein
MIEVGSLLPGETPWTPLFACSGLVPVLCVVSGGWGNPRPYCPCGELLAGCPFAWCCRLKFWCSSDLRISRDVHNFLANRRPVSPAKHRVRSDSFRPMERQRDGLLLLLRSNHMICRSWEPIVSLECVIRVSKVACKTPTPPFYLKS